MKTAIVSCDLCKCLINPGEEYVSADSYLDWTNEHTLVVCEPVPGMKAALRFTFSGECEIHVECLVETLHVEYLKQRSNRVEQAQEV